MNFSDHNSDHILNISDWNYAFRAVPWLSALTPAARDPKRFIIKVSKGLCLGEPSPRPGGQAATTISAGQKSPVAILSPNTDPVSLMHRVKLGDQRWPALGKCVSNYPAAPHRAVSSRLCQQWLTKPRLCPVAPCLPGSWPGPGCPKATAHLTLWQRWPWHSTRSGRADGGEHAVLTGRSTSQWDLHRPFVNNVLVTHTSSLKPCTEE